ncbi:MAG: M28 family peptidase [Myxococcota bacterium]
MVTLVAVLVGLAALSAVVLWFLGTQPVLPSRRKQEPLPAVDASRMQRHVRALSETFHPRDYGHPKHLGAAAEYIREQLEEAGVATREQPYLVAGRTYRNVVAELGPREGERLVVGAHYDTCGPLPGADDNASGVAVLIELAHLLSTTPLKRPVDLVAFTLEEPPNFATASMGSAVHAASLREAGVRVRAMLSLEMLGYFSDEKGSQRFPLSIMKLVYPSRGNFMAVVGRFVDGSLTRRVKRAMAGATDLPIRSINGPRLIAGVDFSDHRSYWDQGFPAVMITDTAFYRNPNYHTARDTLDTLDFPRMAKTVQAVYVAILALIDD